MSRENWNFSVSFVFFLLKNLICYYEVFAKTMRKQNFYRPTLGTPTWPSDYEILTPELILCKKTSTIRYKNGPIIPGFRPPPGVSSSWSRVLNRSRYHSSSANIQENLCSLGQNAHNSLFVNSILHLKAPIGSKCNYWK